MKQQKFKSLGLLLAFSVPETVDEFNDLDKGRENACLEEAINNIVYRNNLAEFRDLFLHGRKGKKAGDGTPLPDIDGVEQVTGIERKTKTVELQGKEEDGSAKTGTTYDESERVYFKRACVAANRTPESFQELADSIVPQIAFDPSASERGGSKTPPKTYLETADKAIAEGKGEVFAAKLSELIGRKVEPERESIAWAIQTDLNRRKAAEEAKLNELLNS